MWEGQYSSGLRGPKTQTVISLSRGVPMFHARILRSWARIPKNMFVQTWSLTRIDTKTDTTFWSKGDTYSSRPIIFGIHVNFRGGTMCFRPRSLGRTVPTGGIFGEIVWKPRVWKTAPKVTIFLENRCLPSKIKWDLTNGPLSKVLELLDTYIDFFDVFFAESTLPSRKRSHIPP